MTEDLLTAGNLILIEENLNKFKKHHQKMAAIKIASDIKANFQDSKDYFITTNSAIYNSGYEQAVIDILNFINQFSYEKA